MYYYASEDEYSQQASVLIDRSFELFYATGKAVANE